MIILQELKLFCEQNESLRIEDPSVTLHFSDLDQEYVARLKKLVEREACSERCCNTDIAVAPFSNRLDEAWSVLQSPSTACLVIMDQCGLKEVTPVVVNKLSECPVTDILFFISSSYIRRFASEESVQKYFNITSEELRESEFRTIHRYICDYYRSLMPEYTNYHLAPFSIKKAGSINGIIFGTNSYLGLNKFLVACWKHDGITGEANYPINEDVSVWNGIPNLFPEFNVPRKFDAFQNELEDYLRIGKLHGKKNDLTNHDIFEFTLGKGFLPKHARQVMKKLQANGNLVVTELATGDRARRGSFYISWDEYQDRRNVPRVSLGIGV